MQRRRGRAAGDGRRDVGKWAEHYRKQIIIYELPSCNISLANISTGIHIHVSSYVCTFGHTYVCMSAYSFTVWVAGASAAAVAAAVGPLGLYVPDIALES